MKICFLITGLGIGGAERHLFNLVPKLKFNVFIISLSNNNDFGVEIEQKGIKVYYLGLNKINLPLVILRLIKIIRAEKPDVIDTYLIHANLIGRIVGKILRINKIICSIRNDYSHLKTLNFLDKITQNLVDLYILNSKSLFDYVHKHNHVPIKKIKYIPNGIDLKRMYGKLDKNYDIRKELSLEKNSFVLSSVLRLIKDKNIPTLMKSLKYLDKNIFLLIIGDGTQKEYLLNLSRKLNLNDNIFFLGKRKDVFNIVNSSDVFILPSLREGMSNALLEAMALKKICIVSNIPQNRELIKNRFNGITFSPLNERELAEKIKKVYENKNLEALSQESFNLIKNKFNIKIIFKSYENIIEAL